MRRSPDQRRRSSRKTPLSAAQVAFLAGLPVAIWLGHLVSGSGSRGAALALALASGLLLLALIARSGAGRSLGRLKLGLPAVLFGLVILFSGLSLTPWWSVGAPAPAWSLIDGADYATIDRTTTLIEIVKLLGLASIVAVSAILTTGTDSARMMFKVLMGLGVVAGLGMVLSHSLGVGYWAGQGRMAGTFVTPNVAADVFGALLILACGWLVTRLEQSGRAFTWPARVTLVAAPAAFALVFGGCLLMTASRGGAAATLACLSGLIVWSILRSSRRLQASLVAAGFATVGFVLFAANVSGALIDRVRPLAEGDSQRELTVTTHWDAFYASPLTGYGLGTFDAVNRQILTSANYLDLWRLNAAHNVFLQWLEEGGLLAAVPMFLCVAALFAYPVFVLFTKSGRPWLAASVFAALVFILHGWLDISLQSYPVAAMFCLLIGAMNGLARSYR